MFLLDLIKNFLVIVLIEKIHVLKILHSENQRVLPMVAIMPFHLEVFIATNIMSNPVIVTPVCGICSNTYDPSYDEQVVLV